jgi:urea transport system permease protein
MCFGAAHALTQDEARAMAAGDNDDRIAALHKVLASGDPALAPFVQALMDDAVKVAPDRVLVVRDGQAVDAATGAAAVVPEGAEDVVNNNRMRRELDAALAAVRLFSPDREQRAAAIARLRDSADEAMLPLVDKARAAETDAVLKGMLDRLAATVLVSAEDRGKRLAAAKALGDSGEPAVRSLLLERLADGAEADPQVRAALSASLDAVDARLAWGERLGVLFTGVSLGSILLLVALGLAITYGLMGVINMAHGELMMIGAYATWIVQDLFRQYAPGAFDGYILAAIPASFLASALVGAVLERSVIRWLYGRPL